MKKAKQLKPSQKNFVKILQLPLFITGLLIFFLFFTITSAFALYERQFTNKVYLGITVDTISLSAKTRDEVRRLFEAKNESFGNTIFTFKHEGMVATASAKDIGLGYNAQLIADQAYSIGRTVNIFADTFNKIRAWRGELALPASYALKQDLLVKQLVNIEKEVTVRPQDAVFELKDDRVVDFRPSIEGQGIDMAKTQEAIFEHIPQIQKGEMQNFEIELPISKVKPRVSLEDTNTLGIKEHLGQGVSSFVGSIPNRMHNIALAASRIDGTIVPKGGVFSFNNAVGDVSKLTGYKEAYIIKDGKTILGDGGGVCQVSTTTFRAVLNAGLPIVERHAHTYRVAYYEQDSAPGLDATIYAPSYDFKFKNDTQGAILIEAYTDVTNAKLAFDFYGTSDSREVSLTKPIITKQVPAPEDRFEDDPTLPKGTVKQVDFKAAGATVTLSRTVKRSDEVLLSDSYVSNYRPWQAVFLRGTKEN